MAKKLPEPEVGWARISERALLGNGVAGVSRVSRRSRGLSGRGPGPAKRRFQRLPTPPAVCMCR